MFEEKNTSSQPSVGPKTTQVNPPPNLPGAEPEDILADLDPVKPIGQRPAAVTAPLSSMAAVPPLPRAEMTEPVISRFKKVIVLTLIILVVGAGALVAGWYGYNYFFVNKTVNLVNESILTNQASNVSPTDNNAGVQVDNQVNLNGDLPVENPLPAVDSDADGLNDQEERLYGTDLLKVDTDNDGLTDYQEVKVFKTDPNNPDTDGDSYQDGQEVQSGYDPKGTGKLLVPPIQ